MKKWNIPVLVIVYTLMTYFCIVIVNALQNEVIIQYRRALMGLVCFLAFLLFIVGLILYALEKKVLYKTFWSLTVYLLIIIIPLFILAELGLLQQFQTVDGLQEAMKNVGEWKYVLFFLIQFLQVTILPLPSSITIAAGVLLFGPLICSIISYAAIVMGSISAFLIGRYLGYRVSSWIVGKEELDMWLKKTEKKSTLLITIMYLFPFFPDDTLCIIAGITTMPMSFFIVSTLIIRAITIFFNAYSFGNKLIPYTTWWGLLIWVIFFIIMFYLIYFIMKKSDKIIAWWDKRKNKKNQ